MEKGGLRTKHVKRLNYARRNCIHKFFWKFELDICRTIYCVLPSFTYKIQFKDIACNKGGDLDTGQAQLTYSESDSSGI